MSQITTCECGSKVRLPADKSNRMFRCPVCKISIALTIDAEVLPAERLGEAAVGCVCPICQTDIQGTEPAISCPACDQVHHCECWSTIGGCGTYGCKQAPTLPKSTPETQKSQSAGWGDEKTCPSCGEDIKASALKCRHCGAKFDTADPMSRKEMKQRTKAKEAAKGLRVFMPILFAASLLGPIAPLVLIVSGIVIATQRSALRQAGPTYVVLGYAALGVSTVFTVLLMAFFAYSVVSGDS